MAKRTPFRWQAMLRIGAAITAVFTLVNFGTAIVSLSSPGEAAATANLFGMSDAMMWFAAVGFTVWLLVPSVCLLAFAQFLDTLEGQTASLSFVIRNLPKEGER